MPDLTTTSTPTRVLAIDPGTRHYGFAVGNSLTASATALDSVDSPRHPPWAQIAELVNEWRVDRVLLGLPLNMDGTESDMSVRARGIAATLASKLEVPVELVDERLSSREAGRGMDNHGEAAVVIALTWLREQAD